jgi:hypothetical protein
MIMDLDKSLPQLRWVQEKEENHSFAQQGLNSSFPGIVIFSN